MKPLGILFFMWAIGYYAAMNVTVRGLPEGPLFLLIALGILFFCWGKRRIKK